MSGFAFLGLLSSIGWGAAPGHFVRVCRWRSAGRVPVVSGLSRCSAPDRAAPVSGKRVSQPLSESA
jgi:hypothetical protein